MPIDNEGMHHPSASGSADSTAGTDGWPSYAKHDPGTAGRAKIAPMESMPWRSQESLERRNAILRDSHDPDLSDIDHYDGCWRAHLPCAVALIEYHLGIIDALRRDLAAECTLAAQLKCERDEALATCTELVDECDGRATEERYHVALQERDEARTWARRLLVQRDAAHMQLDRWPGYFDTVLKQRDEARTVTRRGWDAASQWKAAYKRARLDFATVIRERDAARAALADVTATRAVTLEVARQTLDRAEHERLDAIRDTALRHDDAPDDDTGGWSGILIGATCLDCGAQLIRDSQGKWQECQECHGSPLSDDVAGAALAAITAELRPVVDDEDADAGVCADCGSPLEAVRPGKTQCPVCGVCVTCGRTTYKGKCPACDRSIYRGAVGDGKFNPDYARRWEPDADPGAGCGS